MHLLSKQRLNIFLTPKYRPLFRDTKLYIEFPVVCKQVIGSQITVVYRMSLYRGLHS